MSSVSSMPRQALLQPGALLLMLLLPLLSACGFNTIPTAEESAKAAWSEVLNQYQRRADLIPNLVETVKGYAQQEREVLEAVVEARAKATQVAITPETLQDPNAFKAFQDSQAGLTGALSRLLAVVENYPDLKSNQNFWRCRRSWRARKTGSRSPGATISRRSASTTRRSGLSRRCSGRSSGSPMRSPSRISPSKKTRCRFRR